MSDEHLDAVATEIRACARTMLIGFADSVGKIVLQRFYGGDEARWHRRGPKDVSLRRLAERLEGFGNLSAAALSRFVAIHCFLRNHAEVRELQSVTPSHLRLVMSLPDPDRVSVLEQADAEHWTVDALERRIQARQERAPAGRPRKLPIERGLPRLEKLVFGEDFIIDAGRVSELDQATRERIYGSLVRILEHLDGLKMRLRPKLGLSRGPAVANDVET